LRSGIFENALSIVLVEGIVVEGKVGNVKVEVAVVIVVGRCCTHTGLGITAFRKGESCFDGFFSKCAVALIAVIDIGSCVVGDEKIRVAVEVEVAEKGSEPITLVMIRDAGFLGEIG